jgi:5'-deoxynucleotidase
MSRFFATVYRLKLIQRWGLKRNTTPENVKEHTFDVCVIAHTLCAIKNAYYDGTLDPGEVVLAALYHDAHESITGDLPTPIKQFTPQLHDHYKAIEATASAAIVNTLPDDLQSAFHPFVTETTDADIKALVKAADTISAFVKCTEELNAGNLEFKDALTGIVQRLDTIDLPEVLYFREHFLPALHLSVDELLS